MADIKFKIGDWVHYKIIDEIEDGGDGSIIEEGVTEIMGIGADGLLFIDTGSGLIAKPTECIKVQPKYEIKDFVRASNKVYFSFYRSGFFYYSVERNKGCGGTFQFAIPIEDIGGSTLLTEDKAITFMRWIRKSISDGTLIKTQ